MKKENYNEPIYENLELFSGLDLVYRHPCLHFRADSHECSNCKYGKANKCKIDEEYQKISKDLEILEILKKNTIYYSVDDNVYRIEIILDSDDDGFAEVLRSLLERSK